MKHPNYVSHYKHPWVTYWQYRAEPSLTRIHPPGSLPRTSMFLGHPPSYSGQLSGKTRLRLEEEPDVSQDLLEPCELQRHLLSILCRVPGLRLLRIGEWQVHHGRQRRLPDVQQF